MDHLSSYKVAGVQAAIEATGVARRYLPSSWPALHPIKPYFFPRNVLPHVLLRVCLFWAAWLMDVTQGLSQERAGSQPGRPAGGPYTHGSIRS